MRNAWKLAVVAVAGLLTACPPSGKDGTGTQKAGVAAAPAKNPGAIKVEFFIMSQCPFGVEVMKGVKEPLEKLGADIDFTVDYIGSVDASGNLNSMHGAAEVTGDMAQLCAVKHAPAKYMEMIACQNKDWKNVATNWEQCAKEAQLNVDAIRTCITGPEGKALLTDSFKKAEARGARGSPTIYVNGKPYSGKRSPNAFLKAFCAEYTTKPAVCAAIPAPPAVNVTILSDKRCSKCGPERWVGMAKQRIENPVIKTLDYTDAEGKAFYESLNAPNALLPMVLFDATLDADKEVTEMFARHLQPVGTYKSLNVGGQWNPACANEGGCQLESCKATLACRPEVAKKLEVFVMSECPFGAKAILAMEEVLKAFDNKIDFSVHFIGDGDAAKGFTSMHGQSEVDEDIRQVCAIKHYNKNYKWMEYLACRAKDYRNKEWQKCATGGIDAKVIEKCATGDEGKKLFEADLQIAKNLKIGGSPTWIANGKYDFSGIEAEAIKKAFCAPNKNEIKGCEKTLSSNSGAPQGGCGH